MTLDTEVQSLRQVPMFRGIDPSRLKLLAFTSERIQFAPGQRFFGQGDAADVAGRHVQDADGHGAPQSRFSAARAAFRAALAIVSSTMELSRAPFGQPA